MKDKKPKRKKDNLKWQDYENIDVKGKWVMILRGEPDYSNPASLYVNYSKDRYKVLIAKDKGAAGVILVSSKLEEKTDRLPELLYDNSISGSGIPVVCVKRSLANQMLLTSNKTIEGLIRKINKIKKPVSFETGQAVYAVTQINQVKAKTQNVIGVLYGNDPVLKNEYIVIGAHYDHLGMGGPGTKSQKPDTVAVHNGADDNASGVAGIIELAQKFAANKNLNKRSIIFIAFTGEEMGILGSKYFVKNPVVPIKDIKAMFNFDMIGRLKDKTLVISGSGTALESDSILKANAKGRDFSIKLSADGYGGSDQISFYEEKIPVFFFYDGSTDFYHTPDDDVERIDFASEKLILDYAYDVINGVLNKDKSLTFKEVSSPQKNTETRKTKATLGVVPDFTYAGNDGLRIDGVRKDGPAEKGGLLKGDIITAVNKKSVKNIYDYMARMEEIQPGDKVRVDVNRDGKKLSFEVKL